MSRDHVKWIMGDAMKESIDIYYHIDAVKFSLVRRIEVTAANVHDSQVDLAEEGEKQKIAC